MPEPRARTLRPVPVLLLGLAACGEPAPEGPGADAAPGPRYPLVEVAAESGLDLRLTSGRTPSTQLLEVKGGGVALLDADDDGDLDVFLPNGATLDAPEAGPGARLFRNEGGLRFTDATAEAGVDLARWGFGVAAGDVDGDGHDDLFVACFGRNALLHANGDGTFTEEAAARGLAEHTRWSTAAAWGDLDADGDLDLYVVNYVRFDPEAPPAPMEFRGAHVFGGPMGLPGQPDEVYENDGTGQFTEVTEAWGFGAVSASYGLGATVLDLDGDGAQDVLVGNDSQANFLFRRGEDGRFRDEGLASGLALDENGFGQATMGLAVGDVNDDGLPDVYSTNFMADRNALHVSLGGGRFAERARTLGLGPDTFPLLGWGATFLDLDQDGREELLNVNGHVYSEAVCAPMGWEHDQPPLLFERDGARFRRVSDDAGGPWLAARHCDRGLAHGDLDGDGDPDLVVVESNGPVRLWRNDAGSRPGGGDWLGVRLRDGREGVSNVRGLGARVTLEGGDVARTRWIASGLSYQSSSAPEAHFGLGADAGPFTLRVTWPDGTESSHPVPGTGRVLTLEHP